MITVLTILRWLYKTLATDAAPWQVALGIVLGALAGLLPTSLCTVAAFTLILLINCHFGTAFLAYGLFRMFALASQAWLIRPLGEFSLEFAPHQPLIDAAQSPILAWFFLDYHNVAGAIVLWVLLAVPLYIAGLRLYDRYREKLKEKFAKSRLLRWLTQVWLFKILRWALVG